MNHPSGNAWRNLATAGLAALLLALSAAAAETVAFWAFDEPVGLYPSCVLDDQGPQNLVLVLGPGGSIVPGKFGGALSTAPQPAIKYPAGPVNFGLAPAPMPPGRTVEPMTWANAHFAALITAGEKQLRKEVKGPNPAATGLNLGAFDWTVEFWYCGEPPAGTATDATVFEIGEGPRGENDHMTALLLSADHAGFVLVNQPSGTRLVIPSDRAALSTPGRWAHFAFVYNAAHGELSHFVDGKPAGAPVAAKLRALPVGAEAYFTLGRDARWAHPLPGALDEFRVSRGAVYAGPFTLPASLNTRADAGAPARAPVITEPLRFAAAPTEAAVNLGSSKHLLIDDALFPTHTNLSFVPTPPERIEQVLEASGTFRKHVVVVEDETGLIRLYAPVENDQLAVFTSRDGLHFDAPSLPGGNAQRPNIALSEPVGTPSVFIDPLAPPAEHWKMVSGWDERGIYLFTSPDGYAWTRVPTAVIAARSASQTNMFYDDQRGQYLGYHRTDMGRNAYGKTERRFVMSVTDSLRPPWPFHALTQADYDRADATLHLDKNRPWYLDNGPLTPGGVGIEWPTIFRPTPGFDPDATDFYVPKAVKYPWAPDTYLAFPCVYFHYEGTKPATRSSLGDDEYGRGSGQIETQLMTSRDGANWARRPRPVWLDVGLVAGFDVHQTYMAQGMVRRGDEIWMYTFNSEEYHSSNQKTPERRGVFRTVQRLDRFVAAEAPYDQEATLLSRPLVFTGKNLILNVDTHASGWVQVGLRHADGTPIKGLGVDDCQYINGNELRYPVEWLGHGRDLSALAGQPVVVEIRMRGARLYSLQFTAETAAPAK